MLYIYSIPHKQLPLAIANSAKVINVNNFVLLQLLSNKTLQLGTKCPYFGHYSLPVTNVLIVSQFAIGQLNKWAINPACPITSNALQLWAQLAFNLMQSKSNGAYTWLANQVPGINNACFAMRLGTLQLPIMPGV